MVAALTQDLLGIGQIDRSILFLVVYDCIDVVEVPRAYREHRQQQKLRDILFGLRCIFGRIFRIVPIRISLWKSISEDVYERLEKIQNNGGQGERKGSESNVHIPIAYRLPICQELRLMDHWQRGMHVRKVQIDELFLNMHRGHCDVMFLLQQMSDIVFGMGPFTSSWEVPHAPYHRQISEQLNNGSEHCAGV